MAASANDSPNAWISRRVAELSGGDPVPANRVAALVEQAVGEWNASVSALDAGAARELDAWFALSAHAIVTGDESRLDEIDRGVSRFEPMAVMVRICTHLRRWDADGTVTFERLRGALKELGADATTLRIVGAAVAGGSTTGAVTTAIARYGGSAVHEALLFALDGAAATEPVRRAGVTVLGLGEPPARGLRPLPAARRQAAPPPARRGGLPRRVIDAFAEQAGSDDPLDIEAWLDARVGGARRPDRVEDARPTVVAHLVRWAEAKLRSDQPAVERAIVGVQFEFVASACTSISLRLLGELASRIDRAGGTPSDEIVRRLSVSLWGEQDAERRASLVRVATSGRGAVSPASVLADAWDCLLLLALAIEHVDGPTAVETLRALHKQT